MRCVCFYVCRFLHTASIMKNNLNTFASVCEHVDVVITIIDYFNFVGATIEIDGEMYSTHIFAILRIYYIAYVIRVHHKFILFMVIYIVYIYYFYIWFYFAYK